MLWAQGYAARRDARATLFESARNELRGGTPVARAQAVVDCAKALESAVKVLLDERGIA